MKKILVFLLISFSFLFLSPLSSASCNYYGDVASSLDGCLDDSSLVDGSGDMSLETGVKYTIARWTYTLGGFLGLLAVGSMVYGGLLMTLSAGEDEKVKKGKDIVKWSILWFFAVLITSGLIRIVVELVFDVAS